MGSANTILDQLLADVRLWFANPPDGYTVPIEAAQIANYMTAPDTETAVSPNWVIFHADEIGPGEATAGGRYTAVPIRFNLVSYYSDQASKQAAEQWLNDAIELLMQQLETAISSTYEVVRVQVAQRDRLPFFYGQARTAIIKTDLEIIA